MTWAWAGAAVVCGGVLSVFVPRWAGLDVAARRAILAAYLIRAALLVSLIVLPSLHSFWGLFPDSATYHASGLAQKSAADRGVAIPFPDGYSVLVGLVYIHLAPDPFIVVALNGIADVVTMLLLLVLTERVIGRRPPGWLAWALALWPSWAGWSTQLLKESILLVVSVGAVALIASIVGRAGEPRKVLRNAFVDWLGVMLLLAGIGILRPGLGEIVSAAMGFTAFCSAIAWLRGRARFAQSAVLLLLTVCCVYTNLHLGRLYPVSTEMTGLGYFELGKAYEREHAWLDATSAYRIALTKSSQTIQAAIERRLEMIKDPTSAAYEPPTSSETQRPPISPPESQPQTRPSSGELLNRLQSIVYTFPDRVQNRLVRLENLRRENLLGGSRFGDDANIGSVAGLAAYLPVGLAHVMFAPFPWDLLRQTGDTGSFKLLAMVELPWIYALAVLGLAGIVAVSSSWRADATFLAAYATLGIAALAIVVPNDGLLFRYRLPCFAVLAAFVPLAVDLLPTHAQRFAQGRGAPLG